MTDEVEKSQNDRLTELTAEVVSAYVSKNVIQTSDIPDLIAQVRSALGSTSTEQPAPAETPKPAVPIRKSIQKDYIVCLEDGKRFKSLKRHLSTAFGMTPEEYRRKWDLPADYPMVAPGYAAKRSKLAKEMKLGHKPQRRN